MKNSIFRINDEEQRFELEQEGITAYITFDIIDGKWHLPHTIVPKALGGKGVGTKLVKLSLDYLKDRNIEYVPICTFITAFISKNTEY